MAKKGFLQKAFSAIGLEPTDVDDQDYFDEEYEEEEPQYRDEADDRTYTAQDDLRRDRRSESRGARANNNDVFSSPAETRPDAGRFSERRSNVIQMPDNYRGADSRLRMVIYRPTNFEETQGLIDNLKSRRPVVMNLDEVDVRLAQRMLDFIAGSVYTLGGEIKKVARNIFVVCPANIDLMTDLDEEHSEDLTDRAM